MYMQELQKHLDEQKHQREKEQRSQPTVNSIASQLKSVMNMHKK